jgi:hypothetical protein
MVLGSFLACQTQVVPAARVTGIVVTPEGEPIEGAYVELHLSVPVGVDGGELAELGTARTRADGTYEIEFPETPVLVNAGEKALYALGIVHPEKLPVGTWFEEVPSRAIRLPLKARPPGRDPIKDDCLWLCGPRTHSQCQALSREYFGSEDVCDFRY